MPLISFHGKTEFLIIDIFTWESFVLETKVLEREFQILLEANKFVKASCAMLVKVFCEYNFERTSVTGDPPF